MDQEEIDRLERNIVVAFNKIKSGVGGKSAIGFEKEYGIAYQELVKNGLRPQLKKKYRLS